MPAQTNFREIIVAAMTRQGLIGQGDQLPWHLPAELRQFRAVTLGSTVVMGRNTFGSLGGPLAQRRNFVVSSTLPEQPGITVYRAFSAAVAAALALPEPICYIGGQDIYRQALPRAEALYISWIDGEFRGDVYFPVVHWDEWEAIDEFPGEGFVQIRYRRRQGAT